MNMNMNKILKKAKEYLIACTDIKFAYLFGSFASGKQRKDSDVDIAIMFSDEVKKYDRFTKKLEINNDLENILNKKVDVIDLKNADLPFIHQVLKNKIIIFQRSVEDRVMFEVNFRRKYFDFKPVLDLYTKKVLEKY